MLTWLADIPDLPGVFHIFRYLTFRTLGAAGTLEAVISALALRHGLMPGGVHTHDIDPALNVNYITENRRAPIRRVLSNSFGFGGANCSLVLGRAG